MFFQKKKKDRDKVRSWAVIFTSRRPDTKEKMSQKIAEVFSVSPQDSRKLVAPSPVILFDDLSEDAAERIKSVLRPFGAHVNLTQDEVIKERCSRVIWPRFLDLDFLDGPTKKKNSPAVISLEKEEKTKSSEPDLDALDKKLIARVDSKNKNESKEMDSNEDVKSFRKELNELRNELRLSKEKLRASELEYRTMTEEFQDQSQVYEQKLQVLTGLKNDWEQRANELEKKINSSKVTGKSKDVDENETTEEHSEWKDKFEEANRNIADLQLKIEEESNLRKKYEDEKADLESRYQELEKVKANLESTGTTHQQDAQIQNDGAYADLKDQLENAIKEAEKWKNQSEEFSKTLEKYKVDQSGLELKLSEQRSTLKDRHAIEEEYRELKLQLNRELQKARFLEKSLEKEKMQRVNLDKGRVHLEQALSREQKTHEEALNALQQKQTSLNEQLDAAKRLGQQEREAMQKTLQDLEGKHGSLGSKLKNLELEKLKLQEEIEKGREAVAKSQSLHKSSEENFTKEREQTQQKISDLSEVIQTLNEQLGQHGVDLSSKEISFVELQSNLEDSYKRFEEDRVKSETALKDLNENMAEATEKLAAASLREEQSKIEFEALTELKVNLEEQLKTLEENLKSERNTHAEEIMKAQQERSSSEAEFQSKVDSLTETVQGLESRLRESHEAIESKSHTYRELEDQLVKSETEYKQHREESSVRLSYLENELKTLGQKHDESLLREESSRSRVEALERTKAELEASLSLKQEELQKAKSEFQEIYSKSVSDSHEAMLQSDSFKSDFEKASLELGTLSKEKQELQTSLAETARQLKTTQDAALENQGLFETKISQAEEKAAKFLSDFGEARHRVELLESRITTLQDDLDARNLDVKNARETSKQIISDLTGELKSATKDLDEWKVKAAAYEQRIYGHEQTEKLLKEELAAQGQELDQSKKEAEEIRTQLGSQMQDAARALTDWAHKGAELDAQIKLLQGNKYELQKKIEVSEKQLDQEREQNQEKYNALHVRHEEMIKKSGALEENLREADFEKESLKQRIQHLEISLREEQEKLDHARSEFVEIQAKSNKHLEETQKTLEEWKHEAESAKEVTSELEKEKKDIQTELALRAEQIERSRLDFEEKYRQLSQVNENLMRDFQLEKGKHQKDILQRQEIEKQKMAVNHHRYEELDEKHRLESQKRVDAEKRESLLRHEAEALRQNLRKQFEDADTFKTKHEDIVRDLRMQIDTAGHTLDNERQEFETQKGSLDLEYRAALGELQLLKSQISDYKNKVNSGEQTKEKLGEELNRSVREIEILETKYQDQQRQFRELEEAYAKVNHQFAEKATKLRDISDAYRREKTLREDTERKLVWLEHTKHNLEQLLRDKKVSDYTRQEQELKDELEKYQRDLKSYEAELIKSRDEGKVWQARYQQVDEKLSSLQSELNREEMLRQKRQEQRQSLVSDSEELSHALLNARQKYEQLQGEYKQSRSIFMEKVTDQASELEHWKNKALTSDDSNVNVLKSTNQELQEALKAERTKFSKLEEDYNRARTIYARKITETVQDSDRRQDEVDAMSSEIQKLEAIQKKLTQELNKEIEKFRDQAPPPEDNQS